MKGERIKEEGEKGQCRVHFPTVCLHYFVKLHFFDKEVFAGWLSEHWHKSGRLQIDIQSHKESGFEYELRRVRA